MCVCVGGVRILPFLPLVNLRQWDRDFTLLTLCRHQELQIVRTFSGLVEHFYF